MSKQPEALWIASKLDSVDTKLCDEAAAELRRKHPINTELLEALNECVRLLEFLEPEVSGGYSPDGALNKARATIRKATEKV